MNRDYFTDDNQDNFDEDYETQKCFMQKLNVLEELGNDGSLEYYEHED
jgi:hypothetical protein